VNETTGNLNFNNTSVDQHVDNVNENHSSVHHNQKSLLKNSNEVLADISSSNDLYVPVTDANPAD